MVYDASPVLLYGHPRLWQVTYSGDGAFSNTYVQQHPDAVPGRGQRINAVVVTDPRTYGWFYDDLSLKEHS